MTVRWICVAVVLFLMARLPGTDGDFHWWFEPFAADSQRLLAELVACLVIVLCGKAR